MLVGPAAFHSLCRARDLLSDPDARPTIRAVARAVGISPFHFIRQFEALFGATPHQFRIATRLARAKQLLARDASVTEACMEVGCSSEPNVNPAGKAFQKAMFDEGIPVAAFEVRDLDGEHKRLRSLGVAFTKEPTTMGPVRIAILSDTCGNLIQIYEPPT